MSRAVAVRSDSTARRRFLHRPHRARRSKMKVSPKLRSTGIRSLIFFSFPYPCTNSPAILQRNAIGAIKNPATASRVNNSHRRRQPMSGARTKARLSRSSIRSALRASAMHAWGPSQQSIWLLAGSRTIAQTANRARNSPRLASTRRAAVWYT